ncbi:GntP family permease [Facklamia miroungae]|uniref:Gluconate:H+ symporter, GntP family n=1 Tax=Facklamia miroungae TaxID=120956 RepID=A0A1G7STK0_9LACT|nr:SLC13 family permease [Facklamia miroungae]NKZ29544.1 GntP family permease [Facklamia miroungae]SDG26288.1 gluconate:H+ symporter, GntP family [Facklamia miroungae]
MDGITVTAIGALLGLLLAILLIFKKVPAFYALFVGALVGGLLGGANLVETISLMTNGAQGMTTSILRILAAGILAGVLIKTGSAAAIAHAIIKGLGRERALLAIAIATMILTFVGVFIDISVITVAPIALEIGKELGYSRTALLMAMIGGGKSGNIISPNPNSIAVSDGFGVSLTQVMLAGIIPALIGVLFTAWLAKTLIKKGSQIENTGTPIEEQSVENLPHLWRALSGPFLAILLLAMRPLFNIIIDPMLALPLGGLFGLLVVGQFKHVQEYIQYGLSKMMHVAIILLGTGLIAGVITNSTLGDVLTNSLNSLGLPAYLLAPLAGIFMSAATASTTSGSAVGSAVFSQTILSSGVAPINGAAMLHAGATVLDHLPHGSFFHATGGSVSADFKECLKLIPYESLVGLVLTLISTLIYGVFGG